MEARRLMSADLDKLTLASAFGGDADRVSSDLISAYFRDLSATTPLSSVAQALVDDDTTDIVPYLSDPLGRVGIVITAVDPDALIPALTTLGVGVAASLPSYHRIEAYAPLSALPAISQLGDSGMLGIAGVPIPKLMTGTVNSQADNVLEADRVRTSTPGYNGTGVKIGVLSDSYNKYASSPASLSISSGNLPSNVQVLQDYTSSGTDEGRAMLELIYDLAPGAGLGFATANISEAGFANNIRALYNNGYKVIVDDVFYFDEPFFQDGIVAQAVNDVVASGAAYFSAAGNEGNASYDSGVAAAYSSQPLNFATQIIPVISASNSSYFDWDPGSNVDTTMSVTIPRGTSIQPNFEWDQPFYTTSGVTTNLDFYLISTNTSTGVVTIRASSTTNNVANQIPQSFFSYTNTLTAAVNAVTKFEIVVRNTNGGPAVGRIKFIDLQGPTTVTYNEYFTYSSTVVGHAAAAGAQATGASSFYRQNTPETFSSVGPSTILFNADGSRKASAEVRAKPDILSIDGADTSFFSPGGDADGNGLNNFFGTSAAAPHAAAVAALVLQANPTFTPAQIYARLKATADPTAGNGDPNVIGAGLIDAYRAIFGNPVPVSPLVIDGFESGTLGTDWQVYKQGSGLTQVVTTLTPASGSDQLVLGQNIGYGTSGFVLSGLNEAILHVNLAGLNGLALSFSEKKFSAEADNPMPASFNGHGNYDGVAISTDGVNWYRLLSLTGTNSTTSYQKFTIDISAAAVGLGLTLTSDTMIKFQQYDVNSFVIGYAGIALDNIVVSVQTKISATITDDGTAQRSKVRSLTVDFANTITSAPASAFSLVRASDGTLIPVIVSSLVSLPNGGTRIILTFGGTLEGGSLADGRYTLSINGSALIDSAGRAVDADGDGVDGGTRTLSFFRFFGDSNGDGVVDATDYLTFLTAYRSGNATGVNSIFDFDGSGTFTTADLNAFLVRFNKRRLP